MSSVLADLTLAAKGILDHLLVCRGAIVVGVSSAGRALPYQQGRVLRISHAGVSSLVRCCTIHYSDAVLNQKIDELFLLKDMLCLLLAQAYLGWLHEGWNRLSRSLMLFYTIGTDMALLYDTTVPAFE